jgi:hypothetical protein
MTTPIEARIIILTRSNIGKRPSIYGPWMSWVSRQGVYHPKALSGIVTLRALGLMPLSQRRDPKLGLHVTKRKNQSQG